MTAGTTALSIVVPAYEEAARLPAFLHGLLAFAAERAEHSRRAIEVIVVDDGSRDGTSTVVRRAAAALGAGDARHRVELRLVRLPTNRGKGYAVRTGVVNALGDFVLFCDADGATPMPELARLEAALAAGADLAIGSREIRAPETQVRALLFRRIAGRLFHQVVRGFAVRGIADTQCGFKLFRADVAQELFSRMRMNGYSFDVELLLMARQRGYRIAEVPVNWTHQPGSKIHVVRDGVRMAVDVVRLRWRVWRGHYAEPQIATHHRLTPASLPVIAEPSERR